VTKFVSVVSLVQRATNPTGVSAGEMYYNSVSNEVRVYTGAAWVALGSGSAILPSGGTAGQVLTKINSTDYNAEWAEVSNATGLRYLVRNNTASIIPKGTLVYATGVEGSGRIDVAPFAAIGGTDTEIRVMGMAMDSIGVGVNGYVMSFGTLTGLDTRGTSSSALSVGDEDWDAGTILYAHPTVAGKLTKYSPKHSMIVAFTTVRHASAGQIAIRVEPGQNHLEWMHDVDLTGVEDGDTLVYDSDTSTWLPGASAGGVYAYTGVDGGQVDTGVLLAEITGARITELADGGGVS
jgi:hypothetical protein